MPGVQGSAFRKSCRVKCKREPNLTLDMLQLTPFHIGIKKLPNTTSRYARPFRPHNPNHRVFRYDFLEMIDSYEPTITFIVYSTENPKLIYGEIHFNNKKPYKIVGRSNFTVILKPENSLEIICYSKKERQIHGIDLWPPAHYAQNYPHSKCTIL